MPTDKEMAQVQSDLAAVTYLVEVLFTFHFRDLDQGAAKFDLFSSRMKAQLEAAVVPGFDAATSDDTAQSAYESIMPILERIKRRLAHPTMRAS